jgi:nitrogen fixation protein NifU and related proteins
MDDLYRENILDHYRNPRNFGRLTKPDLTSEDGNPQCGDKIGLDITFKPTTDHRPPTTISDIRFYGEGCAISMASASMLTEKVKGKIVSEVMKLTKDDIMKLLGTTLTLARLKCALLSLQVLHRMLVLAKEKTTTV